MDQHGYGLCTYHGSLVLCRYCETFMTCPSCSSVTEHRHQTFCEPIQRQRAEYRDLREESQRRIQTRSGILLLLAQKTHELVHLMFKAVYPNPLPEGTIAGMVGRLEYPAIFPFRHFPDAHLATPALYICQNEDRKAFNYAVYAINSRINTYNPESEVRLGRSLSQGPLLTQYSVLGNINGIFPANAPFKGGFRVSLTLTKMRVLLDLRKLKENPEMVAEMRAPFVHIPFAAAASHGLRTNPDDLRVILHGGVPITERIASLEEEIRTLAWFPNSMGAGWKNFWKYMCFSPDCAWRQRNSLESLPEDAQKFLYANRAAWAQTPGASIEMGYLGFLGKHWGECMGPMG